MKSSQGHQGVLERVFRRDFVRLVRLNSRYLVFFVGEWLQDKRLGIRTRTSLRGYESLDGQSLVGDPTSATPYITPTPYGTLRRLFDALPPDLSDYSFVDFGSGRGRALIVAAKRGFKQVIGVEFAEAFHRAAERNIAAAGASHCAQSILCDARNFAIPAGPCVLFFSNPFGKAIMDPVARNIALSFAEKPRHIILVFYNETVRGVFDQYRIFRPLRTIKESWFSGLSHPVRYSIKLLETLSGELAIKPAFRG
jgi:16S rRNA G966 N2-methylase RsmD